MLIQNYISAGLNTSQIEQVAAMEFKLRLAMINKLEKAGAVLAGLQFFQQHSLLAGAYFNR